MITIAKDFILFLGGLAGIAYQQITGNVNPLLLLVFTAMTGVPGVTHVIAILRGSATVSQSSLPPSSSSAQEQQSSSSGT